MKLAYMIVKDVKSHDLPFASWLTPFMQLKGAQRSPSQLEMKPEFPATTQEEPQVSHLMWT